MARSTGFGTAISTISLTPGSPAPTSSPTSVRDTTGATGEGSVVVQVDTGTARRGEPAARRSTISSSIRVPVSGSRWRICWPTTRSRKARTLTVVAVSEPGPKRRCRAVWRTGSRTRRRAGAAFADTDHDLAYLVVDPDGHVARGDDPDPDPGRRRHQPAAGGPGRRDVDEPCDTAVQVSPLGNDFDPDGDGVHRRRGARPGPRHDHHRFGTGLQLHPRRRVLRHRHGHLRAPRRPRPGGHGAG